VYSLLDKCSNKQAKEVLAIVSVLHGQKVTSINAPAGTVISAGTGKGTPKRVPNQKKSKTASTEVQALQKQRDSVVSELKSIPLSEDDRRKSVLKVLRDLEAQIKALKAQQGPKNTQ